MKIVKIKKVQIYNFKLFLNSVFDFNDADVVIFDGPNGYGKTTLFDAIELLLTGEISRLCRKEKDLDMRKNFEDNVLVNDQSIDEIFVKAEVEIEGILYVLCKQTFWRENSKNNPTDFSFFKSYLLNSFEESISTAREVGPESFKHLLGKNFIDSYPVMHYIEQDESAFLLKRKEGDRTKFLSYLFHTVEEEREYQKIKDSFEIVKRKEAELKNVILDKEKKSRILKEASLSVEDSEVEYEKIFEDADFDWDRKIINFKASQWKESYKEDLIDLIDLVENSRLIQQAQVNKFLTKYTKAQDVLTFHITTSFFKGKISNYEENETLKTDLTEFIENLNSAVDFDDYSNIDFENLFDLIKASESLVKSFNKAWEELEELSESLEVDEEVLSSIEDLREALKEKMDEELFNDSPECIFCGHKYKNKKELLVKIDLTTEVFDKKLSKTVVSYKKKFANFQLFINDRIIKRITKKVDELEAKMPSEYFELLVLDQEISDSYRAFHSGMQKLEVSIDEFINEDVLFTEEKLGKSIGKLVERLNSKIISVDEKYYDKKYVRMVERYFSGKFNNIKNNSIKLKAKIKFIEISLMRNQNIEIKKLHDEVETLKKSEKGITTLKEKIKILLKIYEDKINKYKSRIISSIEVPFYVYSGRIIQTFNRGNGFIIDIDMEKELRGVRFKTNFFTSHDALFSLSSGQLSALVISFMLSLNRVYAENNLILIDDPVQTMDDVNISSLIELLRSDFSKNQIFLSTHEDHMSLYMGYKFEIAGLNTNTFNLKKIIKTRSSI